MSTRQPACSGSCSIIWRDGHLRAVEHIRSGPPVMKLFLAGDVMTGRGIDQILEHPGDPTLHERWARSAMDYVHLAERRNGTIPRRATPSYIWGDALATLEDAEVNARLINLETAVTDGGAPWPGKGIHYRMHPENVECLTAAAIDCCVLANNHILDWSDTGLEQTLATLSDVGLVTAGAGLDSAGAGEAAVIETQSEARFVVISLGSVGSGIPREWEARIGRPGVALADPMTSETVEAVAASVERAAGDGDPVIVSIHWGPNWGYRIPEQHRKFAHQLIDRAGVDIVHGHSSHHPLPIEVYRGRPIFYGCGDLINDYEGIGGHEQYHPDVRALYLVSFDSQARQLEAVDIVPMISERFSLRHAPLEECQWLRERITDEGQALGTSIETDSEGILTLRW